jgi:2-keto-3-deoxy-galactonokinase
MGMAFEASTARLSGAIGVEEAEALLAWLQATPSPNVSLAACDHLHTAHVQVLMATGAKVSDWPADAALRSWLASALQGT